MRFSESHIFKDGAQYNSKNRSIDLLQTLQAYLRDKNLKVNEGFSSFLLTFFHNEQFFC